MYKEHPEYKERHLKKKSDKNHNHRPIIISFNGGPGSGSLWMHIGYTGPKVLNIDDEGFPTQPYGVKNNPHSILDTADIVFVCPVNTGYSRMIVDENVLLSLIWSYDAMILVLLDTSITVPHTSSK